MRKNLKILILDILGVILTGLVFLVPFYFIIINSFKDSKEASWMQLNLPTSYHIIENYKQVVEAQNGIIVRAFLNSFLLTLFSVIGVVIISSMAGFVLQRRKDKFSGLWIFMILFGLVIPPALVPTIWVLQALNIFKTLFSMVLMEMALLFPFSVLLYKGYMTSIPREIDEAAILDGCGRLRLFFRVIFPLLKPINITMIVLITIFVYSDFVNPLYFLPGARNVTVQLTLFNFMGQWLTKWNLVFANVVLVSIPPLILYFFLNKQIIAGIVAGSLKE